MARQAVVGFGGLVTQRYRVGTVHGIVLNTTMLASYSIASILRE